MHNHRIGFGSDLSHMRVLAVLTAGKRWTAAYMMKRDWLNLSHRISLLLLLSRRAQDGQAPFTCALRVRRQCWAKLRARAPVWRKLLAWDLRDERDRRDRHVTRVSPARGQNRARLPRPHRTCNTGQVVAELKM